MKPPWSMKRPICRRLFPVAHKLTNCEGFDAPRQRLNARRARRASDVMTTHHAKNKMAQDPLYELREWLAQCTLSVHTHELPRRQNELPRTSEVPPICFTVTFLSISKHRLRCSQVDTTEQLAEQLTASSTIGRSALALERRPSATMRTLG